MRLPNAKRITSENMPAEIQPAIDMLAGILNVFMNDVVTAINGNLDLENLVFRLIDIEVIVDSQGNLKTSPDVNLGINRIPRAVFCVNVKVPGNTNAIPDITAMPTVLFNTLEIGKIKMTKVLNIKENKKYLLTLLVI